MSGGAAVRAPASLEPWAWTATEAAEAVRAGRVRPLDLLESCIARIGQVNPAVRAVVGTRFEEARAEAAAAGERAARGERLPLLGVPCTIKEFVAVRGQPQTAGILARREVVADRDATVVTRLRAAGAIVLGVTNVPEGGLWHESSNPVHGRTRNPHDLRRTSGGSSGGEAAILACGGAPFGLGSDAGGSVRIPAGFCGIAAHKPTGGTVPSTGHFPAPGRGVEGMMQIGPMARSVADLRLVMEAISGPDGLDPACTRSFRAREVDLAGLRVVALPTNGVFRPDPEVAAAVHAAAATLRERGARLVPWEGPDPGEGFRWWIARLSSTGERYADLVGGGREPRLRRELPAWFAGRSRHSGGVLSMLLLERLVGALPPPDGLLEAGRRFAAALDEALGEDGVLLHPVFPRTAPRHRWIAARDPRDAAATALFNVTESPVTVVPIGADRRGMPVGVQVVGARGQDGLTLAVAEALERAHGTPAPVEPRRARAGWR